MQASRGATHPRMSHLPAPALRAPAPAPRWRLGVPSRTRAPQLAPTAARAGAGERRRQAAAAYAPPPPAAEAPAEAASGWRTFWAAVDTSAWLGTVGAAVAFLVTQEAMLAAAPVVLPLVALYASRQRERLAAATQQQAQLRRLEALLLDLQAEAADEVAAEVGAEVAAALGAVQRQLRAAGPPADAGKLLRGLDAKLAALEGSVTGTGTATREALAQSGEAQAALAGSVMRRLQDLGTALRRDVNGALQAAGGEELRALSRIEAQLASLESAVTDLQAAQGDGLLRLNSGMQAAVIDAETTLQAAVREEAYRALDPLRRLPELLRDALPVTPEVLGPGDRALPANEDALRALLGEALASATQQIVSQQAALLEELAGTPQAIAPQQWNQLGARLAFLQEQLAELAALQQGAASGQGGEAGAADGSAAAAAAAASAEVAAVAAELTGLRSDLGSLAASLQQLLAAQQQQQQQVQAQAQAGGSGAPPAGVAAGSLAAAAAAVQAVQDQVVLLRQDLDGGDARYASVLAVEQQLEAALRVLFEVLRDAPPAGAGADAAAAAQPAGGGAAAVEELQQRLVAELGGLGGRLDAMAAQLQALQAGVAAAPTRALALPPPPGDAAGPQQQPATDGKAGDGAEGRDEAYQRMQLLLRQGGDRAGGGANGASTSFATWLSGHRENQGPAGSSSGGGSANGVAEPVPAAAAAGGGLQQQIEFAAAMGLTAAEEEAAAAAYEASLSATQPEQWGADRQDAGAQPAEQWPAEQQQQQREQVAPEQPQQPPLAQAAASEQQESAEELYERGVQRLREGRALAATPGAADLGAADTALWEAADCFEQLLARHDPDNIRARGNYGNALQSHARLKKQMLDALASSAPPEPAQAAAVAAAVQRLEGEAQELLLLAGRQYKAVLAADPAQAKAFINWGRVLGLRADMARVAGDGAEAGRLFGLAADKFDAALDLEPQNAQALRLGGQAVLDAALCLLPVDPRESRTLLKDAAAYLEAALSLDPEDGDSAAALEACRGELAALRALRGQA